MSIRIALALASTLFLSAGIVPARAETGGRTSQILHYQIYAAGLNAVTASLTVTEGDGQYRAMLETATRGLLGKIVPWQGTFETEGTIGTDGALRPSVHRSTAVSPKDREVKEYLYAPGGRFIGYKVTNKGRDETPKSIDPKLVENTIDALTAALDAMKDVAADGRCEGSSEVFDGDRRYRLVFRDGGDDILESSRYNVYEGRARRCTAEVVPLIGKWHTKPRGWLSIQEQGRKLGALPTIWMAKMEPGAPAVPVRMKVVTDYGTLYMHVTGYSNDRTSTKQKNEPKREQQENSK